MKQRKNLDTSTQEFMRLQALNRDLVGALKGIKQRAADGIKEAGLHWFGTIGSLRIILRETDAAIAKAES